MSTISKSLFSLQRAGLDPIILRKLARQTGRPYLELRLEVEDLTSTRQPLALTIKTLLVREDN